MEAVGAATSIIALIEFGGKILVTGYGILNTIKNAPIEISRLLGETSSLYALTDQIAKLAKDPNSHASTALSKLQDAHILENCSKVLETIHTTLEKCRGAKDGHNMAGRLKWLFEKKEMNDLMQQLRSFHDVLSTALNVDTEAGIRRLGDTIATIDGRLIDLTIEMITIKRIGESAHEEAAEANSKLGLFMTKLRLTEVEKWLCPVKIDQEKFHQSIFEQHYPKTGQWFLDSPFFNSWVKGKNQLAWVHGILGCGKTVLCATVIEHLRHSLRALSKSSTLVYFYCNSHDPNTQNFRNFISFTANELMQRSDACLKEVHALCASKMPPETSKIPEEVDLIRKAESLSNQEYLILIKRLSLVWEKVVIIVDAVDQCREVQGFIQGLSDLCTTKEISNNPDITVGEHKTSIQVLVTARNQFEVAEEILNLATTESSIMDGIKKDIHLYLEKEVENRRKSHALNLRNQDLAFEIIQALESKADGMFLLARLNLDLICAGTTDKEIRAALHELPEKINDTYSQIIQQLRNKHPKSVHRMKALLNWLVGSMEPLTLEEIAEAISVPPTHDDRRKTGESAGGYFDRDGVATYPPSLASLLGGLIMVRRVENDTVRTLQASADETRSNEATGKGFVDRPVATVFQPVEQDHFRFLATLSHASIGDYLTSEPEEGSPIKEFHLERKKLHAKLAETCIQYLGFQDFATSLKRGSYDARLGKYRFLRYAARHWLEHLRFCSQGGAETLNSELKTKLKWFLQPDADGKQYTSWQEVYQGCNSMQVGFEHRSPLVYAVEFRVTPLIHELFPTKSEQDKLLAGGLAPVHVAARSGNLEVITRLLEAGANVDIKTADNAKQMTALHYAAEEGHLDIVEKLLEFRASISACTTSGTTPFWRAARAGSVRAMEILQVAGSDVNHRNFDNWRPLHEALRCGQVTTVNRLLDPQWKADESFPGSGAHPISKWKREKMEEILEESKMRMVESGNLEPRLISDTWRARFEMTKAYASRLHNGLEDRGLGELFVKWTDRVRLRSPPPPKRVGAHTTNLFGAIQPRPHQPPPHRPPPHQPPLVEQSYPEYQLNREKLKAWLEKRFPGFVVEPKVYIDYWVFTIPEPLTERDTLEIKGLRNKDLNFRRRSLSPEA